MKKIIVLLGMAALIVGLGCKKEKGPAQEEQAKGEVVFSFEQYAGDVELNLKSLSDFPYTNAAGNVFRVDDYKYYVSNIRLIAEDGTEYADPESYFLIDGQKPATWDNLRSIPVGTYKGIKVLLGVDSLKNVSGAQTGALDPIHGMFWTWKTGYIMAKIEGTSPDVPNNKLSFHLGGFSGPYSVLNDVYLDLPDPLVVTEGGRSSIQLRSDVLKWFEAPNRIDFANLPVIAAESEAAFKMAQNYGRSLSVVSVTN